MSETPREIINYSVEAETKARIEELCRLTKRNQGNMIDWLVSEAWDRIQKVTQETKTVEEALTQEAA